MYITLIASVLSSIITIMIIIILSDFFKKMYHKPKNVYDYNLEDRIRLIKTAIVLLNEFKDEKRCIGLCQVIVKSVGLTSKGKIDFMYNETMMNNIIKYILPDLHNIAISHGANINNVWWWDDTDLESRYKTLDSYLQLLKRQKYMK